MRQVYLQYWLPDLVWLVDGSVYTYGYNSYGQLGIGSTTTTHTPTLMVDMAGKTVTHIAVGATHLVVIAGGSYMAACVMCGSHTMC